MSYDRIPIFGISVVLYGLVTAFVESTWTGVAFAAMGQLSAGIGTLVVLLGACLDPVVEKRIAR